VSQSYSAPRLLKALAAKHSSDVFVPECKNGPTQQGSHRRLDAWVLLKTWSPVTTIGYEVKVSRSDWRRDEKLGEYAGLCHLLYIVAPKGIVPIEEVPIGVGLMELVGDGNRLVTRHKAVRREIELPSMLMVYVLMCRVRIERERSDGETSDREWRLRGFREWIARKDERRELHYAISEKIRDRFDQQEREINRLTDKLQALERVERRLAEMGFDSNSPFRFWEVDGRIAKLGRVISPHLLTEIDRVVERLQQTRVALTDLRSEKAPTEDIE